MNWIKRQLAGLIEAGEPPDPASDISTTRTVTLIVLKSYVWLLLLLILITAILWCCNTGEAAGDKWLDLVKIGFTTLGSALTLILGYYFGQRQVSQDKEKTTAEDMKRRMEELLSKQDSEVQPADLDAARNLQLGAPLKNNVVVAEEPPPETPPAEEPPKKDE